ncbi:hypothetical protein [Nocardioides houyundeii]|uniref:hypothetical protein n=1 Tax=Nocardioides houyundeii TaxID=2045452 RepID=UPI0013B37EBA|nr:hypothetical protein [Nocardioides houyundeii]
MSSVTPSSSVHARWAPRRPVGRLLSSTGVLLALSLIVGSLVVGMAGQASAAEKRTWTISATLYDTQVTGTFARDESGLMSDVDITTNANGYVRTYRSPDVVFLWNNASGASFTSEDGALGLRFNHPDTDGVAEGTLVPLDEYALIQCSITPRGDCDANRWTSSGVVVWGAPPAITLTGRPVVTGYTPFGYTLTAADSHVGLTPGQATRSYTWLRDGALIPGAVGKEYKTVADDVGHHISVRLGATQSGWPDASPVESDAFGPIDGGWIDLPKPTVTGVAVVDGTLTASVPGLTPADATLAWYWTRAGEVVGTGDTYRPTPADANQELWINVHARRTHYNLSTAFQVVPRIAPAQFSSLPVATVTGTPKVGQTLTVDAGTVAPTPGRLTYRWFAGSTVISGATDPTHLLTPDEVDTRITVEVTAARDGYAPVVATSAPTAMVAPGTLDVTGSVVVTGTAQVGQTLTVTSSVAATPTAASSSQWLRDGVPVAGATGTTYELTRADIGAAITHRVGFSATGYEAASMTSNPVGPVEDEPAPVPTPTGPPAPTPTPVANVPRPTLALTVAKATLRRGKATRLTWTSTGAGSLIASGAWSGTQEDGGTLMVTPNRLGRTTYVMTAANGAGTVTAEVTVVVSRQKQRLRVKTGDGPHQAGARIMVRSSGLDPRERYTVRIAGRAVAHGLADAQGRVRRTVQIPTRMRRHHGFVKVFGAQPDRTGRDRLTVTAARTPAIA